MGRRQARKPLCRASKRLQGAKAVWGARYLEQLAVAARGAAEAARGPWKEMVYWMIAYNGVEISQAQTAKDSIA